MYGKAISFEMEGKMPQITRDDVPEPESGEEIGGELYNSERDYLEQLRFYKQFQGK